MKRLLAILCVLAMLCALCIPALAADTVRIYAYVPGDWTEAYLYVWKGVGGDGEVPAGWPGTKMDVEGDGWFSAEVPNDMTYAIVNNGNGLQTADLDILMGLDQWITVAGDLSAEVFYEEPRADELPDNNGGTSAQPQGRVTVHASIPADWSEAYVYSWIKDGNGPAWPGDAMTKDGDWWVGTVDAVNNQVIISNNGAPQTIDLTVEAGKEVWVAVTEAGADGKYTADIYYQDPAEGGEPVDPQKPVTPVIPEDANFYVAGYAALCGEDWNPGAEANKMMIGSDGQYEKTFENIPAGDYALKVTIGNWDMSWGGDGADGNYTFSMEQTGRVTVLFNAETQTVSVLVDGEPAQPSDNPSAPAANNYFVAGYAALCGEDWNPGAEANKMTQGADGKYSKTYENVAAGEYALKVTIGNWDQSWGGDGADGNYVFTMEQAGTVTVLFDAETQTVSVEVAGGQEEQPTEAPTQAPTETPTQAPTQAPDNSGNASAQPAKDNTVLIVVIFVIVSAGAIGGALLYKKKQQ